MSRTEYVILTNMCMITDGQQVLVQDRKSKNGLELHSLVAMSSQMSQLFPPSFVRSKKKQV